MSTRRKYRYKGEEKYLPEWATIYGMGITTLRKRLSAGWSLHDALTTPTRERAKNLPSRKANHVGERHGMLKVVSFAGRNASGELTWKCKCKCGGTRIATTRMLGYVTHCGCQRKGRSRRKGNAPTHDQPCWTCKNYVDGCSWARKEHLPVEGWDATPTIKYQGYTRRGELLSYAIHYCPEYVSDGTEGRL